MLPINVLPYHIGYIHWTLATYNCLFMRSDFWHSFFNTSNLTMRSLEQTLDSIHVGLSNGYLAVFIHMHFIQSNIICILFRVKLSLPMHFIQCNILIRLTCPVVLCLHYQCCVPHVLGVVYSIAIFVYRELNQSRYCTEYIYSTKITT